MPIEQLRILAILVCSSFVTPLLVNGGGYFPLFLVQILLAVPLFFRLDLTRIRANFFWRLYPITSLVIFVATLSLGMRGETSVFLLILFCLAYEYYGEKRTQAPSRLLGILSFLVVLSQCRYEHGLWLASGGGVYLLALVFCLFRLEQMKATRGADRDFSFRHVWATVFHGFWAAVCCICLFWILPRYSRTIFMSVPESRANSVAAFSDRVSLNDIATLKLSKRHVMNVTPLKGTVLHSRYLKCKVLDHYQAGFWKSSFAQSKRVFYNRDGGFYARDLPQDFSGFSYRMNIKPMVGNSIFYFDHLVKIDAPFRLLYVTRTQSEIYMPIRYPSSLNYQITCAEEPYFSRSWDHLEPFHQMPANHEYLSSVLDDMLGTAQSSSAADQAAAIIASFRRNYRYTLEINNFDVADPLHEFLINRRAGHCELFASAMVLLLREAGIPARLVTGFLVPEIHPSGDFYHITESDAHAWVEGFFDGGWQVLDPTPPTDFVSPNFLDHQLARLERFWDDLILNWTLQSQLDLAKTLGQMVTALKGWSWRPAWWLLGSAAVGLVVWVAWLLLGIARRAGVFRSRRAMQDLFRRLERMLAARFGPKPLTIAWEEYVRDLPIPSDSKGRLLDFVHGYWRLRFGAPERIQARLVLGDLRAAFGEVKCQLKRTERRQGGFS